MKEETIKEIIDCLPKGKTPFYYFRDRYALMMLSYYVGSGKRVHEIKKSPVGRLMNKRVVKDAAKNAGSGLLTRGVLDSAWPATPECYLLTLDKWGRNSKWNKNYFQTSRPGANLVLQLNFSARHNKPYQKTFRPKEGPPFVFKEHPNAAKGFHTLAWARIDLDFDTDEALIEEIQSDWVEMAMWGKKKAERLLRNPRGGQTYLRRYFENLGCTPEDMIKYVDGVFNPHIKSWSEAMLASAIWFLREEIGINRIFFHTFETGCRLKGLHQSWRRPPRSLYTTLPEKFCFAETKDHPRFLELQRGRRIRSILKSNEARFFHLDF